jgi:hypothetical protein
MIWTPESKKRRTGSQLTSIINIIRTEENAGIAGGVVLFIWGAVAHMALGIGASSMKAMQNEDAVLTAMKENMKESGLYLFPGGVPSNDMTEEQQAEFMRKWEQGPSGFLVFHPNGMPAMSAKTLLTELASNILATLVAAFLLSQALGTLTSFGSRALFVTLIGLVPSRRIHLRRIYRASGRLWPRRRGDGGDCETIAVWD